MKRMDKDSPNDFDLPVFTEPQREPEPVGYENAVAAFEEIIQTMRLREKEPLRREVIEPFVM